MSPTAPAFIELALAGGALELGDFTLKSGRRSPYFLNCGKLVAAAAARKLGELYAAKIGELGLGDAPVLVGLPYKGIPLAALASAALGAGSYAYLRKQAKGHGEGGLLVGEVKEGDSVVLIDDVLTVGTAARQALAQLAELGLRPAALVVAFDRLERLGDEDARAASAALAAEHDLQVASIATVSDLLAAVEPEASQRLQEHLASYGARRGMA